MTSSRRKWVMGQLLYYCLFFCALQSLLNNVRFLEDIKNM